MVRDRFAASIAATLASGHDIRIIATLRADLYDRPLQHPVFGPIVRDATFAVTPMTSTELHDAITLPAERAGVRFEPGLVTTMVGDVVARPGALPLLQFALTELFEQRINGVVTTDAYNDLGGIGGAIARRAEQLYNDTPAGDRDDVKLLFTQLVTPGDDNDDLRRRATHDELTGVDPAVIDRFLTHRLLVTDIHPVTREPVVEVAHEALLREWPRLVEWIDQDRDVIRLRRALHTAAHEWQTADRDEAMLFRGSRLVAAQDATRNATLTPTEHHFLQASNDLDQHERTQADQRGPSTRPARTNDSNACSPPSPSSSSSRWPPGSSPTVNATGPTTKPTPLEPPKRKPNKPERSPQRNGRPRNRRATRRPRNDPPPSVPGTKRWPEDSPHRAPDCCRRTRTTSPCCLPPSPSDSPTRPTPTAPRPLSRRLHCSPRSATTPSASETSRYRRAPPSKGTTHPPVPSTGWSTHLTDEPLAP